MTTFTVLLRDGTARQVPARADGSLMEALRDARIGELLALCGGCCACGTCHVYLDPDSYAQLPPPGADEDGMLDSSLYRRDPSRLSCQVPCADVPPGARITIAPED